MDAAIASASGRRTAAAGPTGPHQSSDVSSSSAIVGDSLADSDPRPLAVVIDSGTRVREELVVIDRLLVAGVVWLRRRLRLHRLSTDRCPGCHSSACALSRLRTGAAVFSNRQRWQLGRPAVGTELNTWRARHPGTRPGWRVPATSHRGQPLRIACACVTRDQTSDAGHKAGRSSDKRGAPRCSCTHRSCCHRYLVRPRSAVFALVTLPSVRGSSP